MIPITAVKLGSEVEQSVLEVIRSGILAQGPKVEQLEREFARAVSVPHAIAVNSGTTALVAAIEAAGIGPGDEVVTSPFTFVATVNAILESGAAVRFADISRADFCVTAASVEAALSPRTRAVIPVYLYGQCADMPGIEATAKRHGLAVIEDAAQAFGATVDGRAAGSFGLGCFSLYATKNLTAGEGGIITTVDDDIAERLRLDRNQGMRRRYEYFQVGHNRRLTDLAAAVALPQLVTYPQTVKQRRLNAERLAEGLDGLPLRTPRQLADREHVWHQFTVQLAPDIDRDAVAEALADRGVGTGVYYPRLAHDYDCYREHPRVIRTSTPVAAAVAASCLSLPVHQHLTEADLNQIVEAVRTVLRRDDVARRVDRGGNHGRPPRSSDQSI
ncbi:dTDP-4-amino-4,6-dideoxygalactose transaminase [Stackebrandtia endophytica]|uniref:dTDP-4-amino-4,6-dideoxygalactose transaminase n=1 Tax=Stackebrandtia endophytica TaxID=1496996 RepID=A0A543ATE4_9ACTN|nr:DegT/DnrJ/EryC1/StrS family aminotransferase [Stackebrandtia endophytica]TQL75848.1 dTDP-4-amino-4,6-dideoxygalactose transaminase [Stackebrandtia endophytica]